MATKIVSIEFHKAQISSDQADNVRRLDLDVSDCALSSWASSENIKAHQCALNALELGAENGSTEPMGYFRKLATLSGEVVPARLFINSFDKYTWLLSDEAAQKYGRKFIPAGSSSRIQKQLGLQEIEVLRPAKRFVACSGGSFIGASMSYYLVESDQTKEF